MNVVIGAKTDPGRRPNNEDQLAVVDVRRHRLQADGVLMVADGMGGRQMGEKASAAAVETVQETLMEMLSPEQQPPADTSEALASALRKANARVYEMSRETESRHGMGTTCVAAVIQERDLFVAHAGDSRAYLFREGRLDRITNDHSYVAEQVRAGTITEEGARQSRFRNVITRAVGIEPTIAPEVTQHQITIGESLLLCSDGLTNAVSEDDIAQTLHYAPSPQSAADRLIQLAIRAGGKDNITAVVARFEIGNRTEQMQTGDIYPFASLKNQQKQQNGKSHDDGEAISDRPSAPLGSYARQGAAAAVILLLALTNGLLIHRVLQDGYRFRLSPPGLVKPQAQAAPPVQTPKIDLAHLTYAPPVTFYIKPVQGGLLSLNNTGTVLTAVTLTGSIVRLAPNGRVLSNTPPPPKSAAAPLPVFAADSDQYTAVDSQNDIYITRAGNGDIVKYSPALKPLGLIPGLNAPAAIAVAPNGTIYVIDSERLKVIRPMPAP